MLRSAHSGAPCCDQNACSLHAHRALECLSDVKSRSAALVATGPNECVDLTIESIKSGGLLLELCGRRGSVRRKLLSAEASVQGCKTGEETRLVTSIGSESSAHFLEANYALECLPARAAGTHGERSALWRRLEAE